MQDPVSQEKARPAAPRNAVASHAGPRCPALSPATLPASAPISAAGRVMWQEDCASQSLGMELEAAENGVARLSMTITPAMLNGHGTCHGGFLFTLADSAFAFACNSHGERAVAQHCSITYLTPVWGGERILAEAREEARRGRSGLYRVVLRRADGEVVALFEGLARFLGTRLSEEEKPHATP